MLLAASCKFPHNTVQAEYFAGAARHRKDPMVMVRVGVRIFVTATFAKADRNHFANGGCKTCASLAGLIARFIIAVTGFAVLPGHRRRSVNFRGSQNFCPKNMY